MVEEGAGGTWNGLANAWITAKLNVANGACAPPGVTDALGNAERILSKHCGGVFAEDAETLAEGYSEALESFNKGLTSPAGRCD